MLYFFNERRILLLYVGCFYMMKRLFFFIVFISEGLLAGVIGEIDFPDVIPAEDVILNLSLSDMNVIHILNKKGELNAEVEESGSFLFQEITECEECKKHALVIYLRGCGHRICSDCLKNEYTCCFCGGDESNCYVDVASTKENLKTIDRVFYRLGKKPLFCQQCKKKVFVLFSTDPGIYWCFLCTLKTGTVEISYDKLRLKKKRALVVGEYVDRLMNSYSDMFAYSEIFAQKITPKKLNNGNCFSVLENAVCFSNSYRQWLIILDEYHKHNVLVRMFNNRFTSVSCKVKEFLNKVSSSATDLSPGTCIDLFRTGGGVGIAFKANSVEKIALFSSNAYIQNKFNAPVVSKGNFDFLRDPSKFGFDQVFTFNMASAAAAAAAAASASASAAAYSRILNMAPYFYNKYPTGIRNKYIKRHLNGYSFWLKIRESFEWYKCIRNKVGIYNQEGKWTSGHVNKGCCFTSQKYKKTSMQKDKHYYDNKKTIKFNEIFVDWGGNSPIILGLVIAAPFEFKHMVSLHELVKELRPADTRAFGLESIDDLPVVLYDSETCSLKNMGSVAHMLDFLEKIKGHGFDERLLRVSPHDFFEYCALLDVTRIIDIQNRESIFSEFLNEQGLAIEKWFDKYTFCDNTERLSDFLTGVAFSWNVDSVSRSTYKVVIFQTVLASVCYRQFLEAYGFYFNDSEAMIIAYASMIGRVLVDYPSLDKHINDKNKKNLLPDCIKGVVEKTLYFLQNVFADDFSPVEMILILAINPNDQRAINALGMLSDRQGVDRDGLIIDFFIISECLSIVNKKLDVFNNPRGDFWCVILLDLQDFFQEEVVKGVYGEKAVHDAKTYIYRKLAVRVPKLMKVIDLVISAHKESPYVKSFVASYKNKGFPKYIGTIDAKIACQGVKEAIQLEMKKHPEDLPTKEGENKYSGVKVRAWEVVTNPLSEYSPFEGFIHVLPNHGLETNVTVDYMNFQEGGIESPGLMPNIPSLKLCIPDKEDIIESATDDSIVNKDCGICGQTFSEEELGQLHKTECGHIFHQYCLERAIASTGTKCPYCRMYLTPCHVEIGQPEGTMVWKLTNTCRCNLDSFVEQVHLCDEPFIQVEYYSKAGTWQGVSFDQDHRKAYLPYDEEGINALNMLIEAYKRGFILGVGYSISRGVEDVVIWKNIPHKTCCCGLSSNVEHGYPDPDYLNRLMGILHEQGIERVGEQ
ncbi:hypothetical protein CI610_02381 [invertebrate metagenome]|uniref:RING-type E3 ubiquitin transferase n=1 Tax=invertebrate metagenome TaxID=1711999 RepID=A0A2H9T643_9ZZZZ